MRIASALILLLAGVGCAPGLEIRVSESADFSRYRTWSWLPDAARTIDAPTPYATGIDLQLAREVERALAERGFEQVAHGGDLRVGAVLNVRREVDHVLERGAVEHLSSYTSDGSYEIQRSFIHRVTYERARLVVYAVHAASRTVVWQGANEQRFADGFPSHVGTVVADLLVAFPGARRDAAPDRREPRIDPPTEWTTTPPDADDPGA